MAQIHFRFVDEEKSFLTVYRQFKKNNLQTQIFSIFYRDIKNSTKMIETFWENQGTTDDLVRYTKMIFDQIGLHNPSPVRPIIFRQIVMGTNFGYHEKTYDFNKDGDYGQMDEMFKRLLTDMAQIVAVQEEE